MSSIGGILKNIFKTGFLRNVLVGAIVITALFPAYEILVAYPRFLKALVATVEDEAKRTAAHFAPSIRPGLTNLTQSALPPAFDDMVTREIHDFGIVKLKVFDKSGRTIYSTDPVALGRINTQDYFHKEVAAGKPYTVTVVKKTRNAESDIYDVDVIETYVPVMSGGEFIGAFELYYDITKAKERMDSALTRAAGGVYALAAGMIVVVVLVLLRASRDDLQRVEIENKLRHAERMQSLGNLAGGVAHNFNNYLLPIVALTKMVAKNLPEQSRDRVRLQRALDAADHAKELVDRIRAFGSETRAVRRRMDVAAAVRESVGFARATLPTFADLQVRMDCDEAPIVGDRPQIETVVLDLVSNAVDALAGKPGKVEVSLSLVAVDGAMAAEISGLEVGGYARLSVVDTGVGMDETTLARVFDPFFTTKEVGQGTGLGLSSAYGIVLKHGGAMKISSRPGAGTKVDVYLPLIDEARPGS